MSFYRPTIIQEWNAIRQKGGYRLLIKKKGWVIILWFFIFYLIRDSLLYLVIPYFALKEISSCF
ncbi:MAG: hypothetical protein CMG32_07255 [Candidatus Marinimicrobia bacterium]|jgi:hypothetical protein|nr:hypothetical protein [Candidatus Neomarinimicrobiota bacterium]